VTGTLGIRHHLFLHTGDPEAPYRPEPDLVRELRSPVTLFLAGDGDLRGSRAPLADYSGDFDGDGRRDLLCDAGNGRLEIYAGTPDGLLAEEPAAMLGIPPPLGCAALESTVGDFDGDGRPDAALFYRSGDGADDRLLLLLTGAE
jgi:hypothetical protein